MESILILPLLIGFFLAVFFIPLWIEKAKSIGLSWKDMNKVQHKEDIAGSGGLIVLMSFIAGAMIYIAIKTFILKTDIVTVEIFALLMTITLSGMIGFIDDVLGWVRGGLSAKLRILLVAFSAVPLMIINAGSSTMSIPLIGNINIGLIYPLILIPIGVIGASTTYNFLAGFNGLEASQGIIILSSLSLVSYLTGATWLALIGLIMVVSLLGFWIYNKFPAKIFPGDVLTYSVGALIAGMAILGNFEKIAVFFFIPYIIETVLKLRGKLKKQSFGIPNEDGSLELPYEKIYGLEHLSIWILKKIKPSKKVYEKDVVYLINAFQIMIIITGILIFGRSLF